MWKACLVCTLFVCGMMQGSDDFEMVSPLSKADCQVQVVWLPQQGQSYSAWYNIDGIKVYRHEVESGQFVYPLLRCLKDEYLRGFYVKIGCPVLSVGVHHVNFSLADADLTHYEPRMTFGSIHLQRFLDEDRPKLHSCGRVYFEEGSLKLSEDAFDEITATGRQMFRWVVVEREVFDREMHDTAMDQARVYINVVGEKVLKGTVWSARFMSALLLDKSCLLSHKFLATKQQLQAVYRYSQRKFRACINYKCVSDVQKMRSKEPLPNKAEKSFSL